MPKKVFNYIVPFLCVALACGMESETRVASTDRLYFRLAGEQDVPLLLVIYANDEIMQKSKSGAMTADEVKEKINRWRQLYAERGFCPLLVMRKTDNALIGVCGITDILWGTPSGPPSYHMEMKINYRFLQIAYGREYGIEAAQGVLAYVGKKSHAE